MPASSGQSSYITQLRVNTAFPGLRISGCVSRVPRCAFKLIGRDKILLIRSKYVLDQTLVEYSEK